MSNYVHPDVTDNGPAYLVANADRVFVCSAQPTTYTQASSTYKLAGKTISSVDFAITDSTGARVTTFAAQAGVPVDSAGTANHVAICDSSESKVLVVFAFSNTALTSAAVVNIPAATYTIGAVS